MRLKYQFYSSESGHVAYQIKGNEVKINMQANDDLKSSHIWGRIKAKILNMCT